MSDEFFDPEDFDEEEHEEEVKEPSECIAIPLEAYSADLALSLLILRWIPEYSHMGVLRTDDKEVHPICGARLLVGTGFSIERRTFNPVNGKSTSGQLFTAFGEGIIKQMLDSSLEADPRDVTFVFKRLYSSIIAPLDRNEECDLTRLATILDPSDDGDSSSKQHMTEQLIDLYEEQFTQRIAWMKSQHLATRTAVRASMEDKRRFHAKGEILYLTRYVPLETIRDILETDKSRGVTLKYLAMPRAVGDAGVYSVRPTKKLKHPGLRDEGLNALLQNGNGTGWIHPNGLIGGWNSMASALDYLRQCVKSAQDKGQ